jgi:hypothetical protein
MSLPVLPFTLTALTSITQNALMLYMSMNYGTLATNGGISCDGANCVLGNTWGTLILTFVIIALVLNALFFFYMLRKVSNGSLKGKTALYSLLIQGLMLAIATNSYNLFIDRNFGSQRDAGNFGATCTALSCTTLNGSSGNAIWGLNIASAVITGVGLLQYWGS